MALRALCCAVAAEVLQAERHADRAYGGPTFNRAAMDHADHFEECATFLEEKANIK